jgi:hypothetical protein
MLKATIGKNYTSDNKGTIFELLCTITYLQVNYYLCKINQTYPMSTQRPISGIRVPLCFSCRHFYKDMVGQYSCAAFNEIPVEILIGRRSHTEPIPGQNDSIAFEPKEKSSFFRASPALAMN